MSKFDKICACIEKHNVEFPLVYRILIGGLIIAFLGFLLIQSKCSPEKKQKPEDTNVYLNESVVFGTDYELKVVGMSVDKDDNADGIKDEENDELSAYTLNLTIQIKKISNKKWTKVVFSSNMFKLKSVNLSSKSPMSVFFETLAQKTIEAAFSIAFDGGINVIEETVGLVGDYTTSVVEELSDNEKMKPIKAAKNQFQPFKMKRKGEEKTIKVSFPIKRQYVNSNNTIVMTIDRTNCWERRVFLILRPKSTENN